jgi:hypothetical protein
MIWSMNRKPKRRSNALTRKFRLEGTRPDGSFVVFGEGLTQQEVDDLSIDLMLSHRATSLCILPEKIGGSDQSGGDMAGVP